MGRSEGRKKRGRKGKEDGKRRGFEREGRGSAATYL